MYCWKCFAKQNLPEKKVSFRASCENCDTDLHVCKNCVYYSPGKPNDCSIPDTLFISDKEKYNFCEDFRPLDKIAPKKTTNKEDLSSRLFKEEPPPKKSFKDLFKDEDS